MPSSEAKSEWRCVRCRAAGLILKGANDTKKATNNIIMLYSMRKSMLSTVFPLIALLLASCCDAFVATRGNRVGGVASGLLGQHQQTELHLRNTDAQKYNFSPSLLQAKKQKSISDNNERSGDNGDVTKMFQKSPATIILAPIVVLFGLDLVLNIAVVTKRSLEVFFTGEYTVWTPWQ